MTRMSNGVTPYQALGRKSVHPFPARMAPELALEEIGRCEERSRVLDPMSGSGTVLAIARKAGHRAVGMDVDPLAVLISKVWTTPVDPSEVAERAAGVLAAARGRRAFRAAESFPPGCDQETRGFLEFWFDHRARSQLLSLSLEIGRVDDPDVRDALWCAFSRLIITKESGASRARDLSHSRPHRAFERAPSEPFSGFVSAARHVAANCIDAGAGDRGPAARARGGDARRMPLRSKSVDLVLTSPPYLNAIDYMRSSKFSLVWMGRSVGELRRIRSASVGAEVGMYEETDGVKRVMSCLDLRPRLGRRDEAVLARYIHDMRRIVGETARVLSSGGRAVYVVGENTVRGTFVRNSRIVEKIALEAGLRPASRRSRRLQDSRRYLPPPSARGAAMGGRIRREVVLTLEKD